MVYLTTVTETLDQVGSVAENIEKYGSNAVILAVFIIILLIVVMYIYGSNKKFIETLISNNQSYYEALKKQNKDLLDKLMDANEQIRNYDEKDLASIFVKLDDNLKSICQEVQRKLKAECVCVYVLHNGTVSIHGLPFFKMSCISEWTRKGSGVSSRIKEHTNLPINLFNDLISGLFQNAEYIIDVDNIENTNFKMFVNGPRVSKSIFIPIYDDENKMMGFIVADFTNELGDDEESIQKVKNELTETAKAMALVLDYSGYREI